MLGKEYFLRGEARAKQYLIKPEKGW